MGDGEKLLTYLNSALKALLGFDIFPRVPKKKREILLPSVISQKDGDATPWSTVLFATSLIIFIKDKIVPTLATMSFCKQKKVLSQESKGDVVVHAMNSHAGSR